MSQQEFTGKTVDLAIEKASEALGLPREEMSVEVIDLPVRRLFSSTPARIRVTWTRPGEEEETVSAPYAESPKETEPAAEPEKPVSAPACEAEPKPAPAAPVPAAVREPEPASAPAAEPAEPEAVPVPASGEKVDEAVAYLRTAAEKMGAQIGTVEAVQVGSIVILNVDGPDVGILIGHRGETMEALSFLIGLAANRGGGDYQKFSLNVSGYREKREKDLIALANRVGAKVQKTGRSYAFEPMNPYERRIIHSAISRMDALSSDSTGEGEDRRVVVRSTAENAQNDVRPAGAGARPHGGSRRGGHGGHGGRGGDRGMHSEHGEHGGAGRGRHSGGHGGSRPSGCTEELPPRRQPTGDEPVAQPRTKTVNDGGDLPLFGKIEL